MSKTWRTLAGAGLGLLTCAVALPSAAQAPAAEEAAVEQAADEAARLEAQAREAAEAAEAMQERAEREEARAAAKVRHKVERAREAAERVRERADREQELYERATEALDEGRWAEAQAKFEAVAALKGRRADGAIYWQAYALAKRGQRAEALAAVERLRAEHAGSRWLKEAQALELEVRQKGGERPRPEDMEDEDLKLMALDGLLHTDPDQAVPLLEKFLAATHSPKLRERALFVLAQTGSPRAREIVVKIARGQQNPDLEATAIQYLGMFGGADSLRLLEELYGQAAPEARRAVLHSYMIAGDKERVLRVVRSEKDPDLLEEAVRMLGAMGATGELGELYGGALPQGVKRAVLQGLMLAGDSARLLELAKSEQDPKLRREVIQQLGVLPASKTNAALVALYEAHKDAETREAVINALFIQQDAKTLVRIARGETDRELKRSAVQRLSLMQAPEARQFLMEILEK